MPSTFHFLAALPCLMLFLAMYLSATNEARLEAPPHPVSLWVRPQPCDGPYDWICAIANKQARDFNARNQYAEE